MTLGDRVAVLRKGVLQQVASPRELYEQPVNLFVAGFIGSPPMNFLPAAVRGDRLELPFLTVPLAPEVREKIGDRTLLIAGIRPEYFEDASLVEDSKRDRGAVFDVQVDVTEWLGDSQYAYIPYEAPEDIARRLGELERELDSEQLRTQMVVSLDPMSRIRDGESASLWLDPARMHLFDPRTGENLTRDAAPVEPAATATPKTPAPRTPA
jgi:multiple sugar transport system ATP-binding protein